MKKQIPDINLVRSAWRRVKENIRDLIARDLQPKKDVKAGGGVKGGSKIGGTGTTRTRGSH
jgi:hypothetical protein